MNWKNILLVILVLIVSGGLVVGGFFLGREFSDKKNENCITENVDEKEEKKDKEEKEEEKEEKTLSYEMLKGTWNYSNSELTELNVKNYDYYSFDSNGTFVSHNCSNGADSGTEGNYIIEDNKLILSFHFSLGSDLSVYSIVPPKTEVIELQDDGSLKIVGDKDTKRAYKKTSEEVSEPFERVNEYMEYLESISLEG